MNFTELKNRFNLAKTNTQLVYINIGVFLVVALINVFDELFGLSPNGLSSKLQLPSDFGILGRQPWGILTYMFLHLNLLHLFFNMLCLYWFGQIFLRHFTSKQLIGLYIFGGIFGGLAYMLCYNYLPYFEGQTTLLCGASASIMALIVAAAMAMPNMQIRLLFIGIIKLKWVAIGTILISMLGITSSNAGGEIAHIGGAAGGWLWTVLLRKNIELTKPIDWIISLFTNIFKILFDRKPKLRHTNRKYHYVKPDEQYNVSHRENNRNLDAILDKIRKSGYSSLTEEEKKQLFDISQKV